MKKKKIFSTLLSLGVAFGIGATTLTYPITDASAAVKDKQEPAILLMNGDSSEVTHQFNVSPGYGHVKMMLVNKGESKVTVYLKHSSGKPYIKKLVLDPGERTDWISNNDPDFKQGVRSGIYELSLTSNDKPTRVQFAYKANSDEW
ncbi:MULTISPECIES: hypothetical protein [Bacillus cereus group]|uniref:hypothetical protein n=1 Tax=Bacillus cereus group TaxID=86661 RepID=UPI0013D3B90B|nr:MULTISPECIES: hypothetical protein [Bacillus cereus group]MCM3202729.1 hypothetical protein [Bacillus cereus]